MLYVGDFDKKEIVKDYIENNQIGNVLIVFNENLKTEYEIKVPHEYIEYSQTIMYKNYYRLLQNIDERTLIVCDEIMMTQNRFQLEYNCINNYTNQTPHRLVFSYFPFIEDSSDYMILLDFHNKNKFKSEPFVPEFLKEEMTYIKPVKLDFRFIDVEISDQEREKYEKTKEKLFAEIGLKDANTIPRNLALLTGKFRSKQAGDVFLARNKRIKGGITYKEGQVATILDFPIKRIEFTTLLAQTKETEITVLTSDLSVDKWFKEDYLNWNKRLGDFYDTAKIS